MLKITSIAVIGALAIAPAAFAKGHSNGNNANAQAMAANIKEFGGVTAKQLSPNSDLGLTQEPSNRGWGNAGSAATGAGALGGDFTAGGQVSKRNK